ncbi:MAG TPA: SDR family oxidoreductase [Planctomycetota bacterium]|nr:SDR family oxidoreductase [Planctomycetota bacterium]
MELKGAVALVTGGSEGIGRAIAEALKAEGAVVTITGRDRKRLEGASGALGVAAIQGDVGREEDARRAVAEVVAKHKRLDLLVNNAGIGHFAPLVETELARLEEVYRTNVFGAFLMAREAARQFVKQRSGHLVNISSTAGTKGFQGGTVYASSKFALRGMTECWREELRRSNVRVMLVNPSEVLTGFGGRPPAENPRKLRPREIADAIVGALRVDDRGFVPEFSVFATNPF